MRATACYPAGSLQPRLLIPSGSSHYVALNLWLEMPESGPLCPPYQLPLDTTYCSPSDTSVCISTLKATLEKMGVFITEVSHL